MYLKVLFKKCYDLFHFTFVFDVRVQEYIQHILLHISHSGTWNHYDLIFGRVSWKGNKIHILGYYSKICSSQYYIRYRYCKSVITNKIDMYVAWSTTQVFHWKCWTCPTVVPHASWFPLFPWQDMWAVFPASSLSPGSQKKSVTYLKITRSHDNHRRVTCCRSGRLRPRQPNQTMTLEWKPRGVTPMQDTVYPIKCAHNIAVLCPGLIFVIVPKGSMRYSYHYPSIYAGIGINVYLPQCQWSKPRRTWSKFVPYEITTITTKYEAWWRHQMETFSALLALCVGNSPVAGEFPAQRPVTRSFDIFSDPHLNKRWSKQSWGWWFETPSRSLWRHCNECMHDFSGVLYSIFYLLIKDSCVTALLRTKPSASR